jgi:ubiquinone/menaquinone biosynthesis C-methylase UbiE
MSKSRSFDRAAGYYDQTRPLPEPVAREGLQSLLDIVAGSGRVLEVGAGTGRISIPLLERGVDLIGCDLSLKMLRRLREKSGSAPILQADALRLPFPAASFGCVMTVHVLHLVAGWQQALGELRRVLEPGGAYLNVRTWAPAGESIRDRLRLHWRGWLAERGVDARLPGAQDNAEVLQELQRLGAEVQELEVTRYPLAFTLANHLDRFAERIYSETWEIPEAIFAPSMQELRAWAEQEFGDLDASRTDLQRFAIDLARFPAY